MALGGYTGVMKTELYTVRVIMARRVSLIMWIYIFGKLSHKLIQRRLISGVWVVSKSGG